MSTWEERMSARHGGGNATARRGLWPSSDEEFRQQKLDAGFRWVDGRWFKPEPSEGPDGYCADCCTWNPQEGIWVVACGHASTAGGCRLGHGHHETEVWLA